jgi:thiopurine S-methyltransferase
MQHDFWQARWRAGQIGFHLDAVNPHLVEHVARLGPPGTRVLVPLCGKSHDLAWLAAAGYDVWGVEFVPEAASAFFAERGLSPETRSLPGGAQALRVGAVTIVVGDLFALDASVVGGAGAIYDRAALVAVDPPRRDDYLARLRALAADDARALFVTMEHDTGSGPPFSVEPEALARLAAGRFALDPLAVHDLLDAEPRWRERGATYLRERIWSGAAT